MLTTKLFCGHCGAYMCGESGKGRSGKVYHYYKCVSVKKKRTDCKKKAIKKDFIEEFVVRHTMKMLADDTIERFPKIRMIFMEPFTLNTGVVAENWDYFREETALRAKAVERVARETNQLYLPLQHLFDAACEKADASYWLRDGVHPTAAGHQMIADAWLDLFEREICK